MKLSLLLSMSLLLSEVKFDSKTDSGKGSSGIGKELKELGDTDCAFPRDDGVGAVAIEG
jgi:hypothetical protein